MNDHFFILKLSPPLVFLTGIHLPNTHSTSPSLVSAGLHFVGQKRNQWVPHLRRVSPISIFYASDQFRNPSIMQPGYGVPLAREIGSRIGMSIQWEVTARLMGIGKRSFLPFEIELEESPWLYMDGKSETATAIFLAVQWWTHHPEEDISETVRKKWSWICD